MQHYAQVMLLKQSFLIKLANLTATPSHDQIIFIYRVFLGLLQWNIPRKVQQFMGSVQVDMDQVFQLLLAKLHIYLI